MSIELQEEIKVAIEKSLPSSVGKILQERLAKAEKDEAALVASQAEIKSLKDGNSVLQDKVNNLSRTLSAHEALDKRKAELDARENKMELTLLQEKLTSALATSEFAKNLALGLVRNTEYRENLYSSGNVPVSVHGGPNASGYVNQYQTNTSDTTSRTAI